MYLYPVHVILLYLYSFKPTHGTESQENENTFWTLYLDKITQNKNTKVQPKNFDVKYSSFKCKNIKYLRLVYDDVELWNSTLEEGKALVNLELSEKSELFQLVHLKFLKDNQEQDVYYKKVKNQFQILDSKESYETERNKLESDPNYYTDDYFIFDLNKNAINPKFISKEHDLVDGVLKTTYTVTHGIAHLVKDEDQELWKHKQKSRHVTSIEKFEFGDRNCLLSLNFFLPNKDPRRKYFFKTSEHTEWKAVEDENEFITKTNTFKSKYFTRKAEYDLSVRPSFNDYFIKRLSPSGNMNVLYVCPTRDQSISRVTFKGTELWVSDPKKGDRVIRLKLTLLDYEVLLARLEILSPPNFPPNERTLYFYKSSGVFKQNSNRDEHCKIRDKIIALADETTPFNYNWTWVQESGKLDISRYKEDEFTIETTEEQNGVVTKTLVPSYPHEFVQVSYNTVDIWPSATHVVNKPMVEKVSFVTKNGLLQLVHFKGSQESSVFHRKFTQTPVDLYFKKVRDSFTAVTLEEFEALKNDLKSPDNYVDKHTHLDLNSTPLDSKLFTIHKDYVDDVYIEVVTPNYVLVTKLTNMRNVLWSDSNSTHYMEKYELLKVNDTSMLLAVHLRPSGELPKSALYFEKLDKNLEWQNLPNYTEENFKEKIISYKSGYSHENIELDLLSRPSESHFNVDVKPLKGNKTQLVVTPKRRKRLKKVRYPDQDSFTSYDVDRVVKVYLYLEAYEVKFVKVDLWRDLPNYVTKQTSLKLYKEGQTWVRDESKFDENLEEFTEQDNGVKFRYKHDWTYPSTVFDLSSFDGDNFTIKESHSGLVKLTTYVPREWMNVEQVFIIGVKLWQIEGEDQNSLKRFSVLECFSKNDLIQLVSLGVSSSHSTDDVEYYHYKREKNEFFRIQHDELRKLRADLQLRDNFVDNWSKFDLSTKVQPSFVSHKKELEDGVEKEVFEFTNTRIFEVKSQSTFWRSLEGEYVTKVEKYNMAPQFLILHLREEENSYKEYYEKDSGESESFVKLEKESFYEKLYEDKDYSYRRVLLNLDSFFDPNFQVLEEDYESTKLYTLYPIKNRRLTRLYHGETMLWEFEEDERLVKTEIYVHEYKPRLIKALVWEDNHTDEPLDQFIYFIFNSRTNLYERVGRQEFEDFMGTVNLLPQMPLNPVQYHNISGIVPAHFHKFVLSDNVDEKLFEVYETTMGSYTMRSFKPRGDTFVNVVETPEKILWKAQKTNHFWKNATFMFDGNSRSHAHIVVQLDSTVQNKYFVFSDENWVEVDPQGFNRLNNRISEPLIYSDR